MSNRPNHLYEFGPFVLNPGEHTLQRNGVPVPLRPKVFDTLVLLVQRHQHLIEKEELMSAVWPGQFVEEGNINKTVSMLRQALGESTDGNRYVETVPKRGYRFVAGVREVKGPAEDELVLETHTRTSLIVEDEMDTSKTAGGPMPATARVALNPPIDLSAASVHLTGRSERLGKWAIPVTAAAFILVVACAYLLYPKGGEAPIASVAVLPFVNETGDPDLDYLSDGLTESLINSLSQIPAEKVIARNSSIKYKGKEFDPREVARSLGVRAILTGRVLRRGDRLHISVELIDAQNNTQIWGEKYERRAADLLAVTGEIARTIVGKLQPHLTMGKQKQLARREAATSVAYELLLKGRFYMQKTTENQKRAIEYFNQAITVDPNYALAHAELSRAYLGLVTINVLDPKEVVPKAEAAALKALELDESLAEAHLAVAGVKLNAWEWAAAEHYFKRAIELNPNLVAAHRRYMFYLIIRGRNDEALAEGRRIRELDPLSYDASMTPIYELLLKRQFDQAIQAAKRLLERERSNPNRHALLAYTYMWKGQHSEAIIAYQEAIKLGDDSRDTQTYLGEAYARAGESEKARAILKQLETGKEYVSPVSLATIYDALSEREQALALLERAYSAHDQQLIWVGVDVGFESLRRDPRFRDLMRRVGLAA